MTLTDPRPAAPYCAMLLEALSPGEEAPALEGELACDLLIVGGGYLGLWTAIEAKRAEPSLSVALIEADICGSGSSGRNSGMALPYWTKFEGLAAQCGEEEALALCDASLAALDEIDAFARENGLDIEFRRSGWLWGAASERQAGRWNGVIGGLERVGRTPFTLLDRAGVDALIEAPGYLAGAYDPAPATIHPGKLARGLRRVALAKGVRLHEQTPMRRLERGARPVVTTPRGRIRAKRVVLAINAWSLAFPELRSGILVITSDDMVTAPAPEFIARHRWRDGLIVTDSALFVSGFRTSVDGRVMGGVTGGKVGYGALSGQRFYGRTPREADILAALARGFGSTAGVEVAASWRGPIDRTQAGLPRYGHLPGTPAVLFGYGFSGNGIVGCRLGGRILASLALERKDRWASCGLVVQPGRWLPPEPLRYVGAHLVRWAVRK
ncbi:MAG TPA: FAD-binding oxidoreductase, partial [Kiloniellales bacterium]|nr:FAD-binding oxidoreductase [Kiloniellales bacterium]